MIPTVIFEMNTLELERTVSHVHVTCYSKVDKCGESLISSDTSVDGVRH